MKNIYSFYSPTYLVRGKISSAAFSSRKSHAEVKGEFLLKENYGLILRVEPPQSMQSSQSSYHKTIPDSVRFVSFFFDGALRRHRASLAIANSYRESLRLRGTGQRSGRLQLQVETAGASCCIAKVRFPGHLAKDQDAIARVAPRVYRTFGGRRRVPADGEGPLQVTHRSDRTCLPFDLGTVSVARISSTASSHGADVFVLGDLMEQHQLHRVVALVVWGARRRRSRQWPRPLPDALCATDISKHRRTARARIILRRPGHFRVQRDRRRPEPSKCGVVAEPVRRAVGGGRWFVTGPA